MAKNRPIVWIVKEQMRRMGQHTEPMDFSPAMSYGEIMFITRHDIPLYTSNSVQMSWELDVANFVMKYNESRDFIIATGQPTAIFAVGYALGLARKTPRYLIWRREDNCYRVLDTPETVTI